MVGIDRAEFADLRLFLAIIRRQSFKAAAIEFGLSPSAASHAIRRLESRLGVKLINRTTRAIVPTELGQDLANKLAEGFDKLDAALQTLDAPGAASFGEVRINAFSDAAHLLIAPALPEFAKTFPDVSLSIVVENRPIDIVAEGYEAASPYGHLVPEDMVAVALSGPQRWVVAGAPSYLARHGKPDTPEDLGNHTCLQLLLGDNSRFPWELGTGPDQKSYRVPGHITIQDTATTISAAKAGLIGFTKAFALETASKGITVNAVTPGYIATEMVMAVPEEVLNTKILPLIPVGRLGEPKEVGRCVVFLASDEAGFITGSTLSANGGQYMT